MIATLYLGNVVEVAVAVDIIRIVLATRIVSRCVVIDYLYLETTTRVRVCIRKRCVDVRCSMFDVSER